MAVAPAFQLVMTPSMVVLTMAADDDSTMAARSGSDSSSLPAERIASPDPLAVPSLLVYGGRQATNRSWTPSVRQKPRRSSQKGCGDIAGPFGWGSDRDPKAAGGDSVRSLLPDQRGQFSIQRAGLAGLEVIASRTSY